MDALSTDDIAALLGKLGLDPATTDVAALLSKLDEVNAAAGTVATVQSSLAELQTATAAKDQELQNLYAEREALEQQKRQAEVTEILAQFADRLTDEKMKTRLSALLLSDRETAMDILNGLPVPGTAAVGEKKGVNPEPPQHDPASTAVADDVSEEEIAVAARARAEQLTKANPKLSWDAAYTQADKEVRAKTAKP